jgi:branched-chain amino acid transport system permease protein
MGCGPSRDGFSKAAQPEKFASVVPTSGQPMLVATDVHRHFEGMRAVDGVSIEVPRGQITGLIGPNGAGKSTFMAVLAGTLPATSGTILFEGQDITHMPAYMRARRGVVRTFQLPSEFARLTVLENLLVAAQDNRGDSLFGALMGKRYWIADERRLVEQARGLLSRFGMTAKESDYAGTMSGGQKRLIEIMRALMLKPRLLLLDEPMSGVHPKIVLEIQHYLESLRTEGLTILMVEHELHMVERLCDTVVVMAQGKVIGSGTMASLRRQREIVDAYLVG